MDLWTRKLATFLFWPPDRALRPAGAEDRGVALIEKVIERRPNAAEIEQLIEWHRLAAGLEIPPFLPDGAPKELELIHPISAEPFPEFGCAVADHDLDEVIDQAVDKLLAEAREFPAADRTKRLYMLFWRRFPDALWEADTDPARKAWWDAMPADRSAPSHGIWEHNGVAAAIAGAQGEPALLLLNMGSAQEFVSAARRTQDSWAASYLFSDFMGAAIEEIADAHGPDAVIFPALRGQPVTDLWLKQLLELDGLEPPEARLSIANFPNVLTALVPGGDAATITAEKAAAALRNRWEKVAGNVKVKVEEAVGVSLGLDLQNDDYWDRIWQRQRERFPERAGVYWVACPWGDPHEAVDAARMEMSDGSDERPLNAFATLLREASGNANAGMSFAVLGRLAGRALAARKGIREFEQAVEPGWKCTLCGEREALRPDHCGSEAQLREFWANLEGVDRRAPDGRDVLKLAGRIRSGDRLCAVCLTKRLALDTYYERALGIDRHMFPSTATIATASLIHDVLANFGVLRTEIEEYATAVRSFLSKQHPVHASHRRASGRDTRAIYFPSSAPPKLSAMANGISQADARAAKTVKELLELDGEWLYEEAYSPEKLRREYRLDPRALEKDADFQRARAAAATLRRAAKERGFRAPSRYMAILAMDGDHMGKWLAGEGEHAPVYEWGFHSDMRTALPPGARDTGVLRPLGAAFQASLSAGLRNFALEVARRVVEEEHCGKLVYAGGDDVVAFLPVADVLPVMRRLRGLFQGRAAGRTGVGELLDAQHGFLRVSSNGVERRHVLTGAHWVGKNRAFEGPTASIGVTIVHEGQPLARAIGDALGEALKVHAKVDLGRNAFAIHFLKRSGSPLRVGAPFYLPGPGGGNGSDTIDVLERLEGVVGDIARQLLSGKLGQDLVASMALAGGGLEWKPATRHQPAAEPWWHRAQVKELARLAKRHLDGREEKKEERQAALQRLDELLAGLHRHARRPLADHEGTRPDTSWRTATDLVQLARALAAEE